MIKKEVVKILHELGIPSHLKGYQYLIDSMLLFQKESLINEVYEEIAVKHNTNSSNIERAIRYAIETGFNRGNYKLIDEVFGYTIPYYKTKPTNKEFIYTLLEKIRLETC